MKPFLFHIVIILLLFSCKKEYKYVEETENIGIFTNNTSSKNKEPKIIVADDDSSAYIIAFQKFCISQKVNEDLSNHLDKSISKPTGFKLLNQDGKDIRNLVYFKNKAKKEEDIKNDIFSMPSVYKDKSSDK